MPSVHEIVAVFRADTRQLTAGTDKAAASTAKLKAETNAASTALGGTSKKLAEIEQSANKAGIATGGLGSKFVGLTGLSLKAGTGLFGMSSAATAGVAALGALGVAVGVKMVHAYDEHEAALIQMQNAFKNNPALVGASVTTFDKLADSMQHVTGVSRDTINAAIAVGARFTTSSGQLKQFTQDALDLSVKMGIDVPEAATKLGRAALGNTRALKDLGINTVEVNKHLKELTTQGQKVSYVMSLIEPRVQGVSAAMGKTLSGQLHILGGDFHDFAISAGKYVVPVLTGIVTALTNLLPLLVHLAPALALGAAGFAAWKIVFTLPAAISALGAAIGGLGGGLATVAAIAGGPFGLALAGAALAISQYITDTHNAAAAQKNFAIGQQKVNALIAQGVPVWEAARAVFAALPKDAEVSWTAAGNFVQRWGKAGQVFAQQLAIANTALRETQANVALLVATPLTFKDTGAMNQLATLANQTFPQFSAAAVAAASTSEDAWGKFVDSTKANIADLNSKLTASFGGGGAAIQQFVGQAKVSMGDLNNALQTEISQQHKWLKDFNNIMAVEGPKKAGAFLTAMQNAGIGSIGVMESVSGSSKKNMDKFISNFNKAEGGAHSIANVLTGPLTKAINDLDRAVRALAPWLFKGDNSGLVSSIKGAVAKVGAAGFRVHEGGLIGKRHHGGGGVAADEVPAILQAGEFVTNKRATKKFLPQLQAMNRYHSGGTVDVAKDSAHALGGLANAAKNMHPVVWVPLLMDPSKWHYVVSGASGGTSGGAAGSYSGGDPYAADMHAKFGYDANFTAAETIVRMESGYNRFAQNPSSSAYGRWQFLDSTWATVGGHKTSDAALQDAYGKTYVYNRYGGPQPALAHELAHHWYGGGLDKVFTKPTIIGVGERGPEHVQVTPTSTALQKVPDWAPAYGLRGERPTVIQIHGNQDVNALAAAVGRILARRGRPPR